MLSASAFSDSIDSIQLLKISPKDERAVIKTPDGKMQIIRVGDAIGESGKVVEITTNRVVLEEMTKTGMDTIIIRPENGTQRTERIKKTADNQPALFTPN